MAGLWFHPNSLFWTLGKILLLIRWLVPQSGFQDFARKVKGGSARQGKFPTTAAQAEPVVLGQTSNVRPLLARIINTHSRLRVTRDGYGRYPPAGELVSA